MSIGAGIFLLVVGAVLAFAVDVQVSGIDLRLVGYILMAAGAVGLILGLVLLTRRRQAVSTTRSAVDPASGEQVTRRSSESDGPLI
ncbi:MULTISPECIES: DUF6458 family protein [unclassified Rathayibacter]|uniref:DUF6458 family protein n=1 Tax=unclassified Rathayibacter TaxID=2609250 RepID=UPI000CE8B297|nr:MULTISPECIES: DUF6458 family protein [unclassified Rathayibacter]PPF36734.1 hypothetical protein C5C10_06105 [Rathayibacter sp. AY1A3]PPG43548.1 hypothetical protein C5C30_04010 [Rathayibacter sp. AY2B5]PPH12179.1 hypothetical protein C5C71_04350 [Rathayibacter sp. AY1C1]PPH17704.1 hypothetical protein C5C35_06385 [Rathayibacter sp. AY1F8]PPH29129.1 hypothetical protein C5C37_08345 [Rathayibacter sp. AY1F9]